MQVGKFLEFDCKLAEDHVAGEGDAPAVQPAPSTVRRGHSLTHCGSCILVFGGTIDGANTFTNQLARLDLERMTWHDQVRALYTFT